MLKAGKPGTLLVEFLRVNHHITARLGEYIDLAPYTLKAHGYRHLPVKTKERVLEEIAAVCAAEGVELSVCEDEDAAYEGLKRFWANPADCCNLKGVARMKQKKAS